jgi:hypothetical protein
VRRCGVRSIGGAASRAPGIGIPGGKISPPQRHFHAAGNGA